jgi:acyl-CoA reductase-like NAD-dependent aldehyde dehydrogenase
MAAPPSADGPDSAVARARAAQAPWGALGVRARARRLKDVRRVLVRRMDDILAVIPAEALAQEWLVVLSLVRYYERHASRVLSRRRVGTAPLLTKHAHKQYEPLGVVAVISPWNYPFMLPALPAVGALVAGNAVVLKPSEIAPQSGRLLGVLLQEALADFPDLVQVVEGDGTVGAALVRAGVDKVAFIGGGLTGRKVLLAAAESLTPVVLELGGNDVAIVCDDANVARAAAGIVWGAMSNAGQCCIGIERAVVAASVHDAFVTALRRELGRLRLGTGEDADMSRLIFPPQRAILDRLVDDAVAQGATAERWPVPPGPEGERFYPPTLLLGATPAMEVNRSEAFGPLLSVMQVQSDDEAVAIANGGPYGLSPSIWTKRRGRARRLAARLEAGLITVNDHLVGFAVPGLPYGGVKGSGFGRLMGDEGLLEFVRVKSVAGARLTLPREPQWFPYRPRHVALARRLLAVWYAPGFLAKLKVLLGGHVARDGPSP